jgi:NAD(P)H-hydrate repair Nnr-like enzyme with NAD(P)H-hydrate epimerase domain
MPLPVVTVEQMRDWEKATWATGQTEAEVIRRVGLAIARHALQFTRPGDLVLLLAGKGHNGDDARAAREHLTDRRVDLLEVTDPTSDLSKLDARISLRPDLVVDGLFGIGLNRPLSPAWVKFINSLNNAQLKVLAVDLPSGRRGRSIRDTHRWEPKVGNVSSDRSELCWAAGSY